MNVNQNDLNALYGSVIRSFEFDFKNNLITLEIVVIENHTKKEYILTFDGVTRLNFVQDRAYIQWEVISFAEIFYIPDCKHLHISEQERLDYNYTIDGDAFEVFIMAEKSYLTQKNR